MVWRKAKELKVQLTIADDTRNINYIWDGSLSLRNKKESSRAFRTRCLGMMRKHWIFCIRRVKETQIEWRRANITYDEASIMAGSSYCLQAIIRNLYLFTEHIHFCAHQVNLFMINTELQCLIILRDAYPKFPLLDKLSIQVV